MKALEWWPKKNKNTTRVFTYEHFGVILVLGNNKEGEEMITDSETIEVKRKIEIFIPSDWEITNIEKFDFEKHGVSAWEDGVGTPNLLDFDYDALALSEVFETNDGQFHDYWVTVKLKPSALMRRRKELEEARRGADLKDKGLPF